jgi:dolichol-phosphate mannosyltransferase
MTTFPQPGARGGAASRGTIEFICFSAVGGSGIVVNLGAYYALTRGGGLPVEVASPIAIELSILWNFALNDVWTFAGREVEGRLLARVGRFHAVALAAGALNYAVLILLTRAGWWDIAANLVGIGTAAVVKFAINSSWTWREQPTGSRPATLTLPEGGPR